MAFSLETFVQAVRLMRDKQKEYFRTRSTNVLVEAKAAERRVDELLADDGQMNLLEDDHG